jgi:predicted DNA-binding protein
MKSKKLRILQQFRLPKDLTDWLSKQSEISGKTKTRLVEEALRAKVSLKEAA